MASSASLCSKKQSLSSEIHEVKTYVEGPKSAKLGQFLTDISMRCHVDLTITSVDKGWFNETIYFTVTGTRDNLTLMNDATKRAFERHNAGL